MIAYDFPAPLWVADQSSTGTVVTGFSKDVFRMSWNLEDCAQGVIALYITSSGGINQWMRDCSAIVRFIVSTTISTSDNGSGLDLDHLAGTHWPGWCL